MGKYAPLGDFLRKQRTSRVPMTFMEIERVVGSTLPKSQRYPAWWSNNPWNNVMTKVWLDAGYMTEQVDIAGRKLVFRRVEEKRAAPKVDHDPSVGFGADSASTRHPLFGWLKGTVHVPPGVDLSEPADPEWSHSLDQ